jgi:hypothetical protein
MSIVAEISWDDMLDGKPLPETQARQAWRAAVDNIVAKAHEKLPECQGRIERAAKLVLSGHVELMVDGTARVASQSNGSTAYHIVNGHCDCRDYEKAPHNFCKHRLSAAIARRAQALLTAKSAPGSHGQAPTLQPPPASSAAAATSALPGPVETPQGVPPQHVVLIQGKPFVKFAGLLQMAHERGLIALTADWTFNDAELSLAHAVATFQDGRRFEESGDATPANTNRKVAVHFRRVALTRAKARVLRDALGIDLVAVEELADE